MNEKKPAFIIAAEKRARELGVSVEVVLQADRTSPSDFPTAECLEPHEVENVTRWGAEELQDPRRAHLDGCLYCGSLVEAAATVDEQLLEEVRALAATAGHRSLKSGFGPRSEAVWSVATRMSAAETLTLGVQLAGADARRRKRGLLGRIIDKVFGVSEPASSDLSAVVREATRCIALAIAEPGSVRDSRQRRQFEVVLDVLSPHDPEATDHLRRSLQSATVASGGNFPEPIISEQAHAR
jgi:hypothetical protein